MQQSNYYKFNFNSIEAPNPHPHRLSPKGFFGVFKINCYPFSEQIFIRRLCLLCGVLRFFVVAFFRIASSYACVFLVICFCLTPQM